MDVPEYSKQEMRTTIRKIENLLTKVFEGKTVFENDLDTLLRYWEFELAKIKKLIEIRETERISSLPDWFALTRRREKENRFNPTS